MLRIHWIEWSKPMNDKDLFEIGVLDRLNVEVTAGQGNVKVLDKQGVKS